VGAILSTSGVQNEGGTKDPLSWAHAGARVEEPDWPRSDPAVRMISRMSGQPLEDRRRQRGRMFVESTLILVLASIVVTVVVLTMGNQLSGFLSDVAAAMG
jgi:Flp pilus assembly pilin Flp